jgi:phage-related protein
LLWVTRRARACLSPSYKILHNQLVSNTLDETSVPLKPVVFISECDKDLRRFPTAVRREIGYAIDKVQRGGKPEKAKVMHGFGGASVLEIRDDYRSDTYRAVYTVRFAGRVYVLHCFQKKSKSGIKTSKQDLDLIKQRLRDAQDQHAAWEQTQRELQQAKGQEP